MKGVYVFFPSITAVTSSQMTCFEGLSSTTLSQLQSVARLAYQGTLKDQLIFHHEQDNIESLGMPIEWAKSINYMHLVMTKYIVC